MRLEELRKKRRQMNININQAAATLKIKPRYLRCLEQGRWQDMPDRAYTRGFLINYARYLGLTDGEIKALIRAVFHSPPAVSGKPSSPSASRRPAGKERPGTSKKELPWLTRRRKGGLAWGLFFLGALFYLGWQASFLVRQPALVIEPLPAKVSSAAMPVTIKGRARRVFTLTINGKLVTPDPDGNFSIPLNLPAGTQTVILDASDRFGHVKRISRQIDVEETQPNR